MVLCAAQARYKPTLHSECDVVGAWVQDLLAPLGGALLPLAIHVVPVSQPAQWAGPLMCLCNWQVVLSQCYLRVILHPEQRQHFACQQFEGTASARLRLLRQACNQQLRAPNMQRWSHAASMRAGQI